MRLFLTRVLENGFSALKRDFLSDLKIFPKPLAAAPKGEERSSEMEEKILERANPVLQNWRFLLLMITLFAGCSSTQELSEEDKRALNRKGEFIYRHHDEYLFAVLQPEHHLREKYPWEASYIGQYPKISKEFFRCKGSHLNPILSVPQLGKEPIKLLDCSGSERHSLPFREGKEFIYPILTDLLNYLQAKTGKRVVVTCGHRCPVHSLYADQSKSNEVSKHMIGAEVDFYVQGLEERPDLVVELLKMFYKEESRYQGLTAYQEFKRYEKDDVDVTTLPWYNQEIFIKLFKKTEGRDFDNRHPYPYLSIQVRYDRDLNQRVTYSWPKAHNNYRREQ